MFQGSLPALVTPLREDGEGEWQDWLVDNSPSQETVLVREEEGQNRLAALRDAGETRETVRRRLGFA